jgi:hypothetical protein
MDNQLEDLSRRISVVIINGAPNSIRDINLSAGGGTGAVFHVNRPDGDVGRYIITNNHLVSEGNIPTGISRNGNYYHIFHDHLGNPGLARLVSRTDMLLEGGRADQAVLEVLDPQRDREEVNGVLRAISFRDYVGFQIGTVRLSARPDSLALESIQDGAIGSGFQISGYPVGIRSDAELNRRNELDFRRERHQFETVAGSVANDGNHFLLFPEQGGEFRQGYSGAIAFDSLTRRPIAILHSAVDSEDAASALESIRQTHPRYNGEEIAIASGLGPAADQIRAIEQARRAGQQTVSNLSSPPVQAGPIHHSVEASHGLASDLRRLGVSGDQVQRPDDTLTSPDDLQLPAVPRVVSPVQIPRPSR